MKTTTVKCFQCGKIFERETYRVEQSIKLDKRIFCSLSCNRITQNKERTDHSFLLDELSPFRLHWKNAKKRVKEKKLIINITINDIKLQWEKQNGICVYSGRKMILPKSSTYDKNSTTSPNRASLDRIIPSKGYVNGNIQWICLMAQYAKNIFAENELLEFCQDVTKKNVFAQ